MTERFRITGPGEYRLRCGMKLVITNKDKIANEFPWVGYYLGSDGVPKHNKWREDGTWDVDHWEESVWDAVGLWEEPNSASEQIKVPLRTSPSFVPFWIVWREDGHTPTFKHNSLDEAKREAERLATKHPGAMFYVLQPSASVYAVAQPIVVWDNH